MNEHSATAFATFKNVSAVVCSQWGTNARSVGLRNLRVVGSSPAGSHTNVWPCFTTGSCPFPSQQSCEHEIKRAVTFALRVVDAEGARSNGSSYDLHMSTALSPREGGRGFAH
jgi:hypothetical protein